MENAERAERLSSSVYDTIQYDAIGYEMLVRTISSDGFNRDYEPSVQEIVPVAYEDPDEGYERPFQEIVSASYEDPARSAEVNDQTVLSSDYITILADTDEETASAILSTGYESLDQENKCMLLSDNDSRSQGSENDDSSSVEETASPCLEVIDDDDEVEPRAISDNYTSLKPGYGYTRLVL